MSGVLESATAILSASERRLEIASRNMANISTPGYKRSIGFSDILASAEGAINVIPLREWHDFLQGKLISSGNPLDLAIDGAGLLAVRAGERILYTRQGQFRMGAEGQVVSPQGYVLQQAGGGDLVIENASVKIVDDGTVLDQGRAIGRIGVYASPDATGLRAIGESHFIAETPLEEAREAGLRQGMLESSNVSMGDEMVTVMGAMRQAESGARLVQVYDELMGKVLTAMGGGR